MVGQALRQRHILTGEVLRARGPGLGGLGEGLHIAAAEFSGFFRCLEDALGTLGHLIHVLLHCNAGLRRAVIHHFLSLRRGFFRHLAHNLALALRHYLNPFLVCPGRSGPGHMCRPGGPSEFAALQHDVVLRACRIGMQGIFLHCTKILGAGFGARGASVSGGDSSAVVKPLMKWVFQGFFCWTDGRW